MATRTIKARVELDGEKQYKQALSELNSGNKVLASEMRKLQAEYKGNADSVEFLNKKSDLLQRQLQQQKDKVTTLREAVANAAKEYGEADKRTQDWIAKLNNAEAAEIELTKSIEDNAAAIKDAETNLTAYEDAITDLDTDSKILASEMAKLKAEYDGNTDSFEYLSKASKKLSDELNVQHEKVEKLREAVKRSAEAYGENDKRTKDFILRLNEAETAEIEIQNQINKTNESLEKQSDTSLGLGDALKGVASKLGVDLPKGATEALNGMNSLSAGTVAAMGAAAAGVMALVGAVKSLQEQTIEAAARADDILTKAAQMNMSNQMYQALQFAAPFVDVDVETLAGSLNKLTAAMGDAAAGSEAAQEKFAKLGVAITNTDGSLRNAYDVWLDTMDALAGIENETERDVAAQELLGKSAASLATIYKQGTGTLREYIKAAEDNYVMSDEQLEQLGAVDDAWNKLQLSIQHNKDTIGAAWAPTAQKALESFDRLVTAAGKALVDSGIIQGFGELVQFTLNLLDPIADLLSAADGAPGRLSPVYEALHAIAGVLAMIADAANVAIGLVQTLTIVGARQGLQRIGTALGYGASSGSYSYMQQWNGTAARMDAQLGGYRGNGGADMSGYGYDSATGRYYDLNTGNYIFHNAGGTNYWKGGLTWVGENGPELVSLPRGSEIMSAQESRTVGTTAIYVTIDAKNVREFNDIIDMAYDAQAQMRMR